MGSVELLVFAQSSVLMQKGFESVSWRMTFSQNFYNCFTLKKMKKKNGMCNEGWGEVHNQNKNVLGNCKNRVNGVNSEIKVKPEGIIKKEEEYYLAPEFKRWETPFGLQQHTFNIILVGAIAHSCMFYYWYYLLPFGHVPWSSLIPALIVGYISGLGVTVGCHRYWTHKTFKASTPLRILLMLMQTLALQYPVFNWSRDHRVHHKYTDTDADPHSSAKGFWFSHMMWIFYPKHPDLKAALKKIDVKDLAEDPIVKFQSKHYGKLAIVFFFALPMYFFHWWCPQMTFVQLFALNMLRWWVSLHIGAFVNSAAHLWGSKPYDKNVSPRENALVSFFGIGEGWHNYHHTFPWDYRAAEYGFKSVNLSNIFIHFFAWIGWAWDLKTVSPKLLQDRINRTGDGSHYQMHYQDKMIPDFDKKDNSDSIKEKTLLCWGWDDKEMKNEDREITKTLFPSKLKYL